MPRFVLPLVLFGLLLPALAGCDGCAWSNLDVDQKAQVCRDVFELVLAPECERARANHGDDAVDICTKALADVSTGCEAAVRKDASLLCPKIREKVDECDRIKGDEPDRSLNVASCKRAVGAAYLLCVTNLPATESNPGVEPLPEPAPESDTPGDGV